MRRVLIAVSLLVVLGTGAAVAFWLIPGPPAASSSSSDLPAKTAQVTKETLVDTQTESGTLGYGAETSVEGKLTGTVTTLPVPGTTIDRGEALYRIDNLPVVLLYGSLPAYRALAVGTEGDDVKQFEENLWALGYRGFTVDDEYSDATATAVKKWQKDLGLPQTGVVELGRVGYAPGSIRVDTLKATLGDSVKPDSALYTYTGAAKMVTVELEMSDERLAKVGDPVEVVLPDGRTTAGKIVDAHTVADSDDSGGSGQSEATTKIEVTVTVEDQQALAGLDGASMDVRFTASKRENVLTVPVAALLALAEGGYGVQVIEGTASRIQPVETGLFAGGRVEVSGQGLAEGMTVGMPS